MIIDADCHISSQRFDSIAITASDLVEQMDRAGVDKALVWLKPPYTKNIDPENKAVYEAIKTYPDRLVGFGWVNPRLGKDHSIATIKRCFEEYGFYGIKFNGAQDDYVIDDASVLPLIELAASYDRIISFHIGADFYENTHPYRLGNIAGLFPNTRFFMIHMGGAGLPSLDRSAIETAKKHPNIMLIGSAILDRPILRAIDTLGPDRLCFGSDMPFKLMHVQLAAYRAMLRDLSQDAVNKILGGNFKRFVGI